MTAEFHAYRRPGVHGAATAVPGDPRLTGHLRLEVRDDLAVVRQPDVPFALAGPADVVGVESSVVVKRHPAPGVADAETTKAPFVELAPPDLPWRYTAVTPTPEGLRPWLVLVVGAAEAMRLDPAGRLRVPAVVTAAHDLAKSALWGHTQTYAGGEVARLLAPVDMQPGIRYLAALVPAFRIEGGRLVDAWTPAAESPPLPMFDSWSFTTVADHDDFAKMARRLEAPTAAEWQRLRDAHFGSAAVRYQRPAAPPEEPDQPPELDQLPVRAALSLVPGPGEEPVDAGDPPAAVTADLAALAGTATEVDGRWVLGLPRYADPWPLPPSAVAAARWWTDELVDDPRRRGAAGLGSWAASEWQDRIADAAADQAGALAAAAERVRHLVLGLAASRSLWARRVPDDPVARLAMLGPMLAKLPADTGTTVLGALAARVPTLAAVRSGAARRALRPGTTAARLARPGAVAAAAVLHAANTCPPTPPAAGADLADRVVELLGGLGFSEWLPSEAQLDEESGEHYDSRRLVDFQPRHDGIRGEEAAEAVEELRGLLDPGAPDPDPCRPIGDLAALGEAVAAACDPNGAQPAALVRVRATVHGLPEPWLAPPDLSPELDLPLSVFVAERAPDWLLPGARDLPMDRVIAAASNPVFVEAFLVGANHRATGELRWRNLPLVTGWMPLRRFWNRIGRAGTPDEGPLTDVDGIVDLDRLRAATRPDGTLDPAADWLRWPAGTRLGDPSHLPDPTRGANLVVLFRTPLFRRYPATVVTLVPAAAGPDGPDWSVDPDPTKAVDPSFGGSIGDDLTYFGFPVEPSAGDDHWVVVEEPPPGYQFRSSSPGHPVWAGNGAKVAADTLVRPVRVLLGQLVGGEA